MALLSHLNSHRPVLAVTQPNPFFHSLPPHSIFQPKHQSRNVPQQGEHADIHVWLVGLNKQFFSSRVMVIPPVGVIMYPNPAPPLPITSTTTTSLFEAPLRPLAGHPLQAQRMVLVPPIRKEAAPLNMAGFIAPTPALRLQVIPPSGHRATPGPAYRKTSTL
jgi:hypothetical protein